MLMLIGIFQLLLLPLVNLHSPQNNVSIEHRIPKRNKLIEPSNIDYQEVEQLIKEANRQLRIIGGDSYVPDLPLGLIHKETKQAGGGYPSAGGDLYPPLKPPITLLPPVATPGPVISIVTGAASGTAGPTPGAAVSSAPSATSDSGGIPTVPPPPPPPPAVQPSPIPGDLLTNLLMLLSRLLGMLLGMLGLG